MTVVIVILSILALPTVTLLVVFLVSVVFSRRSNDPELDKLFREWVPGVSFPGKQIDDEAIGDSTVRPANPGSSPSQLRQCPVVYVPEGCDCIQSGSNKWQLRIYFSLWNATSHTNVVVYNIEAHEYVETTEWFPPLTIGHERPRIVLRQGLLLGL